jgi:hypothetical protein
MDKLKWAVFVFAVLSIVGGAVVYMTGQQGLNRDSFFRRRFWIADICSWIVAAYTNFVSKAEPLKIGGCEIKLGHCGSNQDGR